MKTASVIFCLFAFLSIPAAPVVTLSIQETAGIARTAEDITMGVPLPETDPYTDPALFTLRDAGNNVIPCEITAVSHWFKAQNRIRWLQLNFPFSIAANATQSVTLNLETSPYSLASNLSAVDNGATITVNTGKIRFIVKKANFNLIDQAWVDESGAQAYSDANKIVASHSRGLIHYISNVEYLSSNDAASTAVIERQGPGVVTLKASGVLKNASGGATLSFVVRIYAYNNSASVKMYTSVEFVNSDVFATVKLQGIHLEVPLNLGATRNAAVGKPGGYSTAALSGGQDAFCMVARPSGSPTSAGSTLNGSLGGQVAASTFNPKSPKPKDIGWVGLSDGVRGCVAAMKYFWQMAPTSVEAFGDGKIIVGFFSKRSGQTPFDFFAGTARSCETRWTFFNTATPDQMRSYAAGATDRLFALASPYWYTRRTHAFLPLVEVNQNLYSPANWSVVSGWDTKLNNLWNNVLNSDDSHLGYDAYGWMEWGDNPHYATGLPVPCEMFWNGNYYGLDFHAFEHYVHTGDRRFLLYAIAHAQHVADVHQGHFGDASANTGASRYCPPANHIATDDGNCTPTIGNMSHHKTEGLFMDYYLTGNDRSLQAAMEGAGWCERLGYSYAVGPSQNIDTYVRRWAHQMNTIVWAYEYTLEKKYFDRLWQNWEIFRRNIYTPANPGGNTIGQPFMVGLAMEAAVKMYYILTPNYTTNLNVVKPDSVPHFMKIWCDRVATMPTGTGSAQINSNVTIGYAFLAPFYGASYLTTAASKAAILPNSQSNMHKDFAQQARNLEMAMYYFALPESVAVGVGVEDGRPGPAAAQALTLDMAPNPFNPRVRISLGGSALGKDERPVVRIFSINGVLVDDLSGRIRPADRSVVWQAPSASPAVYVVKCSAGGKTRSGRIVLLK